MANNLEVTFYAFTGYSFSDEPASEAVIEQNEHWIMPKTIIGDIQKGAPDPITVSLSEDELRKVDYVKLRDVDTGERAYYFVVNKERFNAGAVSLTIVLDAFATVGLQNISFFGNIVRRSLSPGEAQDYPLLPEPWAPKRPLRVRRFLLDAYSGKRLRIPTHIDVEFEEEESEISDTATIDVPNSPLSMSTTSDSLSVSAELKIGYPNVATTESHTISSPWGSISYETPYEAYIDLSGDAAAEFLEKAKKYNALDLVGQAFYLPESSSQSVPLPEIAQTGKYPKANKFYTVITIRSLANGSSQTYSDNDTVLQASLPIAVVVVPDKTGGIYVIPSTIRDTGLNAYTYASGLYSPFETTVLNAVGDTPAKFASDGTVAINTALNGLFQEYVSKINALQYTNMQAKYFKEMGLVQGTVMSFFAEIVGGVTKTTTETEGGVSWTYNSRSRSGNPNPPEWPEPPYPGWTYGTSANNVFDSFTTTPGGTSTSTVTTEGAKRTVAEGVQIARDGIDEVYGAPDWDTLDTILFGSFRNEVHALMLGNINDYLNRWASIENDIHNGKVANLFKNVTLVGSFSNTNIVAGKYEVLVSSLHPDDAANFDLFLDHFGHAVDEYSHALVKDVREGYNYTLVGEDAIVANAVRPELSAVILGQFRAGVRTWKTLVRPQYF